MKSGLSSDVVNVGRLSVTEHLAVHGALLQIDFPFPQIALAESARRGEMEDPFPPLEQPDGAGPDVQRLDRFQQQALQDLTEFRVELIGCAILRTASKHCGRRIACAPRPAIPERNACSSVENS